jgi:hypothetical protein
VISKGALIEMKKDIDRGKLYRADYERLFKATKGFADRQLDLIMEAEAWQAKSILYRKQYDQAYKQLQKESRPKWWHYIVAAAAGYFIHDVMN